MLKMKRGLTRILAGLAIIGTIYLVGSSQKSKRLTQPAAQSNAVRSDQKYERKAELDFNFQIEGKGQATPSKECLPVIPASTDINTVEEFAKLEMQPAWMRGKEFWDVSFEKRFLHRKARWKKMPLKVILMPHSHADPGWLKTFEEYYFHQVSAILNNMIEKMYAHPSMTFVWSEISFLSLWYDKAHPSLRHKLKSLVESGRLEILTGGWVMTDEATSHLYAMLTELIEGHQWLSNNLDVVPRHGWAIDVFGHGAAVPYLLKESGINSTVIQRVHYAWKQWFAEKQSGDFLWRQSWDSQGDTDVLVHNRPYDIYSIKHSCGPHTQVCLNFDFRKIFGEYTEYSIKSVNIDAKNVRLKSEQLLDEYGRTGSLHPHNVVLVPIGDDFRYDHATEWDQQYNNYQQIIDFINANASYNAHLQWGTLRDYFEEVEARNKKFKTLQGDFFVYSDIFTQGRPAYWSGYFTTRPYYKLLSKQLEAVLHSTEVFYVAARNAISPGGSFHRILQVLDKDYEKLVKARRALSLFQHHDAITGTSKGFVMHDYAMKLQESIHNCYNILGHTSLTLLATTPTLQRLRHESWPFDYLQPNFERPTYDKLPKTLPIEITGEQRVIVMTNSLAHRRREVVKLLVLNLSLRITDEYGNDVPFQINPIWDASEEGGMLPVSDQFELLFIADLAPLSLVTYTLHSTQSQVSKSRLATVYSNNYGRDKSSSKPFQLLDVVAGDVQLESNRLKLVFDGSSGMISSVTDKQTGRITQLSHHYASYPSAQFKSGAYLFQPDPNAPEPEEDVFAGAKPRIFIQTGPLTSEFTVMFSTVLMHSYRIFHVADEPLASAIYMENSFNLGGHYNSTETPGFSSQYKQTELFFRLRTDLDNGIRPVFYTDQGSLSMQKRVLVPSIGIEGNYYPITSAAYIQESPGAADGGRRLTLLVDHATGSASWKQGWLEVMVERRTIYDDARGMGEGVTDQKRTVGRYWLLIEKMVASEEVPRLSLAAHHLSNSFNVPAHILVLEGLESIALKGATYLSTRPFPCNLHLLSLRSLSMPEYPALVPSDQALLTIQHQSPSCAVASAVSTCRSFNESLPTQFALNLPITTLHKTSLTGIYKKGQLQSISDLTVPQHRLRSVLISFSQSRPDQFS